MSGKSIPRYPNSCLASSSQSNSTVFLVGVSASVNGRLEVNSVDLTDINTPLVKLTTFNEEVLFWRSQSSIICHNYPVYKTDEDDLMNPIHIQQFGPEWTFDTNIYPNGKVEFPSYFPGIALTSARNYIVVGHHGSASWSLAHTNITNSVSGSTWTTFQLNPTDSFKIYSDDHMDRFPAADPFLSVGTYILNSDIPARGYAIIFDTASSGWIYPTSGYIVGLSKYSGNMLQLDSPVALNMNKIILSQEAIGVTMGVDAYILDKASDNTTIIYYINPKSSTLLQRVNTTSPSPQYKSSLVATSLGSHIAVYSSTINGPQFNIFNTSSRTWSGLDLEPALVTSTTTPSLEPSPTNQINNNIENKSKALSLPVIVGSVIGALTLFALIAFTLVRRKSRRKHASDRCPKNYDRNSKIELLKEEQCMGHIISVARSPQLYPTQFCSPPPQSKALGRNPQSPVLESFNFLTTQSDDSHTEPHFPNKKGRAKNGDNRKLLRQQQKQRTHSNVTPPTRQLESILFTHTQNSHYSLTQTLADASYQLNNSESNLGQHSKSTRGSSPSSSSSTLDLSTSRTPFQQSRTHLGKSECVTTLATSTSSHPSFPSLPAYQPSLPFHSSSSNMNSLKKQ